MEAREDVGGQERADDVAEVLDAVHARQGGGDENAGHDGSVWAASGRRFKGRRRLWAWLRDEGGRPAARRGGEMALTRCAFASGRRAGWGGCAQLAWRASYRDRPRRANAQRIGLCRRS